MNISLNEQNAKLFTLFLFVFLPLLLMLGGAIFGLMNALFYILAITWFGMGIIFFKAIY
jgi:hypothetical protein